MLAWLAVPALYLIALALFRLADSLTAIRQVQGREVRIQGRIAAILALIAHALGHPEAPADIELDIPEGPSEEQPTDEDRPMSRITQTQRKLFGPITGKNKKTGEVEPLDTSVTPTVVSSRTNIVVIDRFAPDPVGAPDVFDDRFFYARATGALDPDSPDDPTKLTTVDITVSADADLGDGIKLVSRTITLEVVDAGAGDLDIPEGEPEELP